MAIDKNTNTALVCRETRIVKHTGKGKMSAENCDLVNVDELGFELKVGGVFEDGVFTPEDDPRSELIETLNSFDADSYEDPIKTILKILQG